ncbi:MAG: 3-isopropylmalate dehydratase small subunit [Spirochaetia bacterium]|nr:3-isopropylmalate dehydratase small subunit [Spirochaetia bacterium]
MNSSSIKQMQGSIIPYSGNDIDTDRILPARFMKRLTFEGLEKGLFIDERQAFAREKKLHVFDDVRFARASILIVNQNFGCGSSREHAPQSLRRHGVQCIIGESFGEIFASNCMTIGLPVLRANHQTIARLQDLANSKPEAQSVVDLAARSIQFESEAFDLQMDEGARVMFLEGRWDSVAEMLVARNRITELDTTLPSFIAEAKNVAQAK